jgi:hypothetical protein
MTARTTWPSSGIDPTIPQEWSVSSIGPMSTMASGHVWLISDMTVMALLLGDGVTVAPAGSDASVELPCESPSVLVD